MKNDKNLDEKKRIITEIIDPQLSLHNIYSEQEIQHLRKEISHLKEDELNELSEVTESRIFLDYVQLFGTVDLSREQIYFALMESVHVNFRTSVEIIDLNTIKFHEGLRVKINDGAIKIHFSGKFWDNPSLTENVIKVYKAVECLVCTSEELQATRFKVSRIDIAKNYYNLVKLEYVKPINPFKARESIMLIDEEKAMLTIGTRGSKSFMRVYPKHMDKPENQEHSVKRFGTTGYCRLEYEIRSGGLRDNDIIYLDDITTNSMILLFKNNWKNKRIECPVMMYCKNSANIKDKEFDVKSLLTQDRTRKMMVTMLTKMDELQIDELTYFAKEQKKIQESYEKYKKDRFN